MSISNLNQALARQEHAIDELWLIAKRQIGVYLTWLEHGMKINPDHPLTEQLKGIRAAQEALIQTLSAFKASTLTLGKGLTFPNWTVSIRKLSGEISIYEVSPLDSIRFTLKRFVQENALENGYSNPQMTELYPRMVALFSYSFFYYGKPTQHEEKTNEHEPDENGNRQCFLNRGDESWFSRFGDDIPVIHFLMNPPADTMRHEIMKRLKKYLAKKKSRIVVDEDVFWHDYYLPWYMKTDIFPRHLDHDDILYRDPFFLPVLSDMVRSCEVVRIETDRGRPILPMTDPSWLGEPRLRQWEGVTYWLSSPEGYVFETCTCNKPHRWVGQFEQYHGGLRRPESCPIWVPLDMDVPVPVGHPHIRQWLGRKCWVDHEYRVWEWFSDSMSGAWLGVFDPIKRVICTDVPEHPSPIRSALPARTSSA